MRKLIGFQLSAIQVIRSSTIYSGSRLGAVRKRPNPLTPFPTREGGTGVLERGQSIPHRHENCYKALWSMYLRTAM
jgi:hypothetical protein